MIELKHTNRQFGAMLAMAEQSLSHQDLRSAAALAQLAACFAFPANAGLFASPRLERLLLALGRQIPNDPGQHIPERRGKKRVVLHVLSYAKPIGGDSRFAWRWIQQDSESRHVVAVTSQADIAGTYEVPQVFKDATAASGGFVHCLQSPRSSPMEAARELRTLCRGADVVALHLYPYDIVPILALAHGCDTAKTLYVNHSDHTFWLGASVAHVIANLRSQPPDFENRCRALRPGISPLLPIPLDGPGSSSPKREAARKELGLGSDEVLLLTIASPFKYQSPGRVGLLDLVLPVLAQSERTRLVAVGPERTGDWESAHTRTNGRVMPLGRRWGNDALYAAADIYLDSVPFSSITSLLEAGIHGTPLLGFAPAGDELRLLGPGTPGLDTVMAVPTSVDAYQQELRALIESETRRREIGAATRQRIIAEHGETAWLKRLSEIYQQLARADTRGRLEIREDRFDAGSLAMAVVQLFKQVQGGARQRQLIGQHIGALPYRDRAVLTWQLYRIGLDMCYLNLMPPPLESAVRQAGRQIKALLAS